MSKTFNQNYTVKLRKEKYNVYEKQYAKLHQTNANYKSKMKLLENIIYNDANYKQKKDDLKKIKHKYYSNEYYMSFLKTKMDRISYFIHTSA